VGGEFVHDLLDRILELVDGDAAFFAGLDETAEQLLALEGLPRSVPLHHEDVPPLELFVSREPEGAVEAFPAPTDREPVFGKAGIDDLVFKAIAFGTTHG